MSDPITRLNAALEGRYRIERELGEGGMATVYLADDLKHERKVALKVLKPELAAVVGADRFLAEIKTTANLQHPHILPLFDSGEADSFLFYVMPYVEGESLRDRLNREKQLPVDEAVRIAADVADALQAAHEQGVIHRDIKPANILLSRGRPLVADFGIALAVSAAGGGRLTETGLSLGTPYYMSPEQASADREPSAASDVYSLGCVLYEMLVGEPPFTGGSAQAVLAKILMGDAPAPTKTRSSIPPHVDAVIRKALERLPADRFSNAGGLAAALAESGFRYGAPVSASPAGLERRLHTRLAAAGAVVAVGAFALGGWLGRSTADRTPPASSVVRFTLPVPGGYENSVSNEVPSLAISPDGGTIVYGEDGRLMRRVLESGEVEPISGAEGAEAPFFSPDGEWLGFLQDDGFRRMSSNGVVTSVGNAVIDWAHGVDWAEDGTIVYGRSFLGIWRISAEGGEPEAITDPSLRSEEQGHMWPQSLRGGSLLLFSAIGGSGKWHDSKIVLKDLATGERTTLIEGAAYGRYLPSGHIVYGTEDGTINAQRVNLDTKEMGPAVPLESGVLLGQWGGGVMFAVSASGTLVYVRGDNSRNHVLTWYDLAGTELGTLGGAMTVAWGLEIDPTGRRVAATMPSNRNDDIYLLEEGMISPRRFTSHPASDGWPVWSPDGTRIAWQRDQDGTATVLVRDIEGDSEAVSVHTGQGGVWPRSWSPDGRWLAISERRGESQQDIIAVDMENPGNVLTVLAGPNEEWDPQFSRDGRFLAFDWNEAGPHETYVVSFPPTHDPIRITTGDSRHPRWSPTRNELYFWSGRTLMAATYRGGPSFAVESVRPLFTVPNYVMSDDPYYAVAPSGDRFLIQEHNPEAAIHELQVVVNWSTLIERVNGR